MNSFTLHNITTANVHNVGSYTEIRDQPAGWVSLEFHAEKKGDKSMEVCLHADDLPQLLCTLGDAVARARMEATGLGFGEHTPELRSYYDLDAVERTMTAKEAIGAYNLDFQKCDWILELEVGTSERCTDEYHATTNRSDTK